MTDRDVALKEGHELREKLGERDKSGGGKSTLDFDSRWVIFVSFLPLSLSLPLSLFKEGHDLRERIEDFQD